MVFGAPGMKTHLLPHGCCVPLCPKKRVFGDVKYFSEAPYANWRFEVYRNDRVFCRCTAYGAVLCGTPFTTCLKWSGPKKQSVYNIPYIEWPRMRHTTYGVLDAKSAICNVPYMADHPYGTYCPFSEFWRITLKIRIWRVTVCKRLGG